MTFQFRQLHFLWIALFVVTADQITKWLAVKHLTLGEPVAVLPFLNFSFAMNRGAAFSFLNSASGWQNPFFISLAAIICLGLIVWLLRLDKTDKLSAVGIGFIVGGAMGNVVDRFHYGYVVDFIDTFVGIYHWPTFNLADAAVTLGVILILTSSFRQQHDG